MKVDNNIQDAFNLWQSRVKSQNKTLKDSNEVLKLKTQKMIVKVKMLQTKSMKVIFNIVELQKEELKLLKLERT